MDTLTHSELSLLRALVSEAAVDGVIDSDNETRELLEKLGRMQAETTE